MQVNYIFQNPSYLTIPNWISQGLSSRAISIACDNPISPHFTSPYHMTTSDWDAMCSNPNGVEMVKIGMRYCPENLNWIYIIENESMIEVVEPLIRIYDILTGYLDNYFDIDELIESPLAVHLLNRFLPENEKELLNAYYHAIKDVNEYVYDETHFIDAQSYIWSCISKHPTAVRLLENNLDKIDWDELSLNPEAIHLLELCPHMINWDNLSSNNKATRLLESNVDKINWNNASSNSSICHLLEQNLDKVNWSKLCLNENAVYILERYPRMIDWMLLSLNENAIRILEKYQNRINWAFISTNPKSSDLISNNAALIPNECLCRSEAALSFLEKNQHYVDWYEIRHNKGIVVYNYQFIKQDRFLLNREIHEYLFHPFRIMRWINAGNQIEDYLQ